MNKRLAIISLTLLALTAVLYLKTLQPRPISSPSSSVSSHITTKSTLYLFHDPKDQDEECRRIYELADKAERELSDRLTVRRPDILRESALLNRYSVQVLPTILILSPDGKEKARFEGEGDSVASAVSNEFEKLKRQ